MEGQGEPMMTSQSEATSSATAAATTTVAPVTERYHFSRMSNGKKAYVIKGNNFEVPDCYTVTARLGQGSYGMVVQAVDTRNGEKVAIKKCGSVFKYPEDGKRILREIKLMQMMNHRNVLGIMDVLPPNDRNFEDVYIVMTCADTDLSNIIRSQTLSEGHCRYIIYQILRGLKYVHSANVLHRDLKPANILINFDCRIKICDFGLARGADPTKKQNLTSYVVTRWYRAPELLLDNTRYSAAIDIWASGCIFGELLRGSALFPGESSLDQMHKVSDGVGIPEDDDLWWIQSTKARDYLKSRCEKENRPSNPSLTQLLPPDIKPLAMDFIKHMLAFNPYKRWSSDWLLDHPYLAEYHRPDSCTRATEHFRWQWDSVCPDVPTLRALFWREMAAFHPEIEAFPGGTGSTSAMPSGLSSPLLPTTPSSNPIPSAAAAPTSTSLPREHTTTSSASATATRAASAGSLVASRTAETTTSGGRVTTTTTTTTVTHHHLVSEETKAKLGLGTTKVVGGGFGGLVGTSVAGGAEGGRPRVALEERKELHNSKAGCLTAGLPTSLSYTTVSR